MAQKCFASISDTGKNCSHFETRQDPTEKVEMYCGFCVLHNKRCIDLGYYCEDFDEEKE